jgi:hypothetical protein
MRALRRRVPCRLTLVVAVAISLGSTVAFAETPDADVLFRQGRAAADVGDYPHACIAFTESLRLDPAAGTVLNLADCEEHMGRLASAWTHFLRVASVLPGTDERRDVGRERAATLASRVPWLAITLAADAPGDARVFCDDVEVDRGRLATPLPLDPGPHTVLVVAPGHESRITAVLAVERETVHVTASAGATTPQEAPPPAAPAHHHAAAWIVGAAGIASLGVGTYFGARALAERSWSDASCTGGMCANAAALGEYQAARSDARASDVALGIGVVALAVGGFLLLTSSSSDAHAGMALRVTGTGLGGAW